MQALNYETEKMFKAKGSIKNHEERFEFNLFAFSQYLLYLKELNSSKHFEFQNIVISFYSKLVNEIGKQDPFFHRVITDIDSYVKDKIESYQFEIKSIKSNSSHSVKYIFASFYNHYR